MAHWFDRLALRAAAGSLGRVETPSVGTPERPHRARLSQLSQRNLAEPGATRAPEDLALLLHATPPPPSDGQFSRRAGLRTLGLAASILAVGPLRLFGSSAAEAAAADCLPGCLSEAERVYRLNSIRCNSGIPEPVEFLGYLVYTNPFCQLTAYQFLVSARRACVNTADCGRKEPPPPAPPPPRRSPPPAPTGGCGFQGLTSCGDICCPAGSLCAGSSCIPPPPPSADQCNPPCPPGKKCQQGQCVDAALTCKDTCVGGKCCPYQGGEICWNATSPCP